MNKEIKIKVCGMRDAENIQSLLALQPDYMGFIFYPKSARFVGEVLSPTVLKNFPSSTKKVGVFVKASLEEIRQAAEKYQLDAAQLHGGESPEFCAQVQALGLTTIKVFSVGEDFDFGQLDEFETVCDYYLFDTKGKHYGGHGETFDWNILKGYQSQKPIFLSGGLDANNVANVLSLELPIYAVDVNSKFEIEPGLKNIELLKNVVFKTFRHEA